MIGPSSGFAVRAWTEPRLEGRRLQALMVIAGKVCSGSPNASRDRGWTWICTFGVA